MSYADVGAGTPILLVHGWAANGGFFQDLGSRLAATHRVLTLTLRGHPGSGQGQSPLTIETLADDIVHFIEALDLKGVVALGWSMGAMALWDASPKLGSRLASLIIEDMAPRLTNDAAWGHGISGDYDSNDVADTLAEIEADWPAYVARFAPRMFAPGLKDKSPDLIDWASAEMSNANARAMASLWASRAKSTPTAQPHSWRTPHRTQRASLFQAPVTFRISKRQMHFSTTSKISSARSGGVN
jgi:pimeloyl-[acyl-carrier protein] methyl ester esterase